MLCCCVCGRISCVICPFLLLFLVFFVCVERECGVLMCCGSFGDGVIVRVAFFVFLCFWCVRKPV